MVSSVVDQAGALRETGFGWKKAVFASLLAISLAGCDSGSGLGSFFSSKEKDDPDFDRPPETLYNEGLTQLGDRDYSEATKKFGKLEKYYPYSEYTKKSLILTTYAKYDQGDYSEAIASGRRFVQLYPSDKDTPYAMYLVGMSYFNQIPDITRDQERAEKALAAFDELLQRYPDSEYANDARTRVMVARDQLAGKEMEVGRFYLEQRNYTGAINRFREVLIKYQTTRHTEESLARLAEAYLSMGIADEAQTAGAVLGHNFPDSQWYKQTFALLKSGGLEPRENTNSWISKAVKAIIGG
jgi:outer membrane protein assembly factor BamD